MEIPVEASFACQRLMEVLVYVDGSAVLAEGATAEQRAKHQSESQKAFPIIAMSVNTSQLYLITSCEEPKEAWGVLKKHFREKLCRSSIFEEK